MATLRSGMPCDSISDLPCDAFIGGEWIPAGTGDRFAVVDPADGNEIARVADCGLAETERAIETANRSGQVWGRESPRDRSQILRAWHDLIVAETESLATIITCEMGKPIAEARAEVAYGASYLQWYCEEALRISGETFQTSIEGSQGLTVRAPIGVCAAITPWNFPNAMLMRKAAPALAAGCTMVVKPAEESPLSALALAQLAKKAGVPNGVLNVVPTSQPQIVGGALTSSDQVRKLSFTGSTEVGKLLLEQCAPTVKRTSMELGGNAPFIVFEDADIQAAVEGLIASKFRNAGQTCVCTNRILVQDSVHDRFVAELSNAVSRLRVGRGLDESTNIGPLVNGEAVAKIERLLAEAIEAGADLVSGGRSSPVGSNYFEPTIVTGVTEEMSIFRNEIFGPIATVMSFDSEEEAYAAANDTPYGLAAYCYTQDVGRAWRATGALEFGMVAINSGILSAPEAPFGGIKHSGHGKEGSRHGLDEYLELKFILMGGVHQ